MDKKPPVPKFGSIRDNKMETEIQNFFAEIAYIEPPPPPQKQPK
jgi:hypothetical protein